ncbi:MAG: C39 family peptidase [Chloroflexota bacterium]|nr:C39 family peptidase [Chloroflexota bacterium]
MRASRPARIVLGLVLAWMLVSGWPVAARAAVALPDGGAAVSTAPRRARPPVPRLAALPASHYLHRVSHEYQNPNNCGPVTTNMVLSQYGIHLTEAYTAGKLRPNPRDVSVTALEMVTFA